MITLNKNVPLMKLFSAKGITKILKIPKEVIGGRKSEKDGWYNCQKKKDKNTNSNLHELHELVLQNDKQRLLYQWHRSFRGSSETNSTNSCSGTISSAYSTSGSRSFRGSSETWTPRIYVLRNDKQYLLYQWHLFVLWEFWDLNSKNSYSPERSAAPTLPVELVRSVGVMRFDKSSSKVILGQLFYFFFLKNKLSIFEGRQGEIETRVDLFVFLCFFCMCAKIRDREMADHNVVGYKVKNKAKFHCRYSSKIQQKTHWKRQSRYIIVVGFLCVLLGCTRANMIVNLLL